MMAARAVEMVEEAMEGEDVDPAAEVVAVEGVGARVIGSRRPENHLGWET